MPAPACDRLVCCCGFMKKIKKIKWRKTVAIHYVFKEKTTKLNFQPA
jgi:hypothetical protein